MKSGHLLLLISLSACSAPAREAHTPTRGTQSAPTLGLGRAATPREIAALDIDVRPDGPGLPDGSGTAAAGAGIYAARCASCHGAEGEGTPAGVLLVGRVPNDAFNFGADRSLENRKTVGSTPLRVEKLRAGSHLIWIERDGYRRWTRVVAVGTAGEP